MTPHQALEAARETVTLAECPIGLFLCGDELCLKTEYGNNDGRIDAYIVSSGEFFWGDKPQTIASQRAQLVRPVSLVTDALKADQGTVTEGGTGTYPVGQLEWPRAGGGNAADTGMGGNAALSRQPSPPAGTGEPSEWHARATRAVKALRTPDASLIRVANTVRQSIADVIQEAIDHPAGTTPQAEGWKLVPVHATLAMHRAVWEAQTPQGDNAVTVLHDGRASAIDVLWSAMLAASPTPPATVQRGETR